MGKVVLKNAVERRAGHLYYVDGAGNVCEAVMSRGGRKKKATTKRTAAKRTTARRTTARTTARRRR